MVGPSRAIEDEDADDEEKDEPDEESNVQAEVEEAVKGAPFDQLAKRMCRSQRRGVKVPCLACFDYLTADLHCPRENDGVDQGLQ